MRWVACVLGLVLAASAPADEMAAEDGAAVLHGSELLKQALRVIAAPAEDDAALTPVEAQRRERARAAARTLLDGGGVEWLSSDARVARALRGAVPTELSGGGTATAISGADTETLRHRDRDRDSVSSRSDEAATVHRPAVPRRVNTTQVRRMLGASGGGNRCPSPTPETLLADPHEHRSLNFTGDYDSAGSRTCSWLLQCAPGAKNQAVVLRFRSLSTFYGGDATPPLGAGDSVLVYPDPGDGVQGQIYFELSGPSAAQDGSSYGVPFEQSFGAASDTMRVELQFVWGQRAAFAAEYWCATARSLTRGCTDSGAENFDVSADADDGSCTYGDVPGLLSAAFQMDAAERAPYGWGTDNDPCVSHKAGCGGWEGIFCHRLTMGKITAWRPVLVDLSGSDVSLTLGAGIAQLNTLQMVDLHQTGLHGVLPQSLGGLQSLLSLSLYETALSGTIPAGIDSLGSLSALDLDTTRITGTIPASLGNLSKLTFLQLYNSGLSGSLPLELGELSKLQYLSLSSTSISGYLPAGMAKMQSLRVLHLGGCRLSGSLPHGLLGNLSALEELDLTETNINGTLPADIGDMHSLRTLELSRTQISGVLVPELGRLRGLRVLDLATTHISGTLTSELGGMASLQTLALGQTRISGTLNPAALGGLTSLKEFSMASTSVSGFIPQALLNLTRLSRLQLQGTRVSGTLTPHIRSWTAMQILDLPEAQLSGTLPPSVGSMSALTELSLYHNRLSGTVPEETGLLPTLENLYLDGMSLSGTLPNMSGCLALRVMRLKNNSFTTVPVALPPNLTHLYMDMNPVSTTGEKLCAMRPQSVEVLSIAFSAVSILLESSAHNPGQSCELSGGECRGTWVTPPDQCWIGDNCSWTFQLRDARDQSATVGGVLHNLSIGLNCSDPDRQRTCARSAPMIDNRDGTFTATVPGFPEGHNGSWIQMKGLHSFHFFHEERGFTPYTDGDGNSSPNNEERLRSANFLPRLCPSQSNTVPDIETGSTCVCEKGFGRSDPSSRCTISCPEFGTEASKDGSTCVCADNFYDYEQSGRVACVVQDYPPTRYPASTDDKWDHYDGSALITASDAHLRLPKCLPCPQVCATCIQGQIVSKEGWRLRGSVGHRDLTEQLTAFNPHSERILLLCPTQYGSSYGDPSGNETAPSVCPSLPLENVDLQRRDTTCHLGRVGPLCQSCGPDKYVGDDGWCTDCPDATFAVYVKLAILVLVAVVFLIVLLYLVSWSRGDMQTAQKTWQDVNDTISRQLSRQVRHTNTCCLLSHFHMQI